jgi:hypothetical protein
MYPLAMNRHDMIRLVGAAALGHVAGPLETDAVPLLPKTMTLKLFMLAGEHVQAWCSAPSIEDAERLFQENLEPFELSATSMREVKEDEWEHFGIRKSPGNSTMISPGEARLLACNRGDYH